MKARRFLIAGCWLVASREGALQADSPKPVLSLIEKDGKSVYLFPDEPLKDKDHACGHSSSYDVECCGWSNLPKNWAYLDRSHWRKDVPTLHVLPHWTWPERIGRTVPVYVYTSYLSAELFVNGQSQGRRTFDRRSRLDRFRLRWREVVYAPEDTLRFVRIDVVDERGDDWPDCGQPDLVCGDGGVCCLLLQRGPARHGFVFGTLDEGVRRKPGRCRRV